jgi:hypothetical protein
VFLDENFVQAVIMATDDALEILLSFGEDSVVIEFDMIYGVQ